MNFTHYVLTDNATGVEYVEPFAGQVHSILGPIGADGLTYDQATRQIAIWNRSQAVHRQEFSYRLGAGSPAQSVDSPALSS